MSIADELKKLAELKEAGVLTEEEFEGQKRKLLSGGGDKAEIAGGAPLSEEPVVAPGAQEAAVAGTPSEDIEEDGGWGCGSILSFLLIFLAFLYFFGFFDDSDTPTATDSPVAENGSGDEALEYNEDCRFLTEEQFQQIKSGEGRMTKTEVLEIACNARPVHGVWFWKIKGPGYLDSVTVFFKNGMVTGVDRD